MPGEGGTAAAPSGFRRGNSASGTGGAARKVIIIHPADFRKPESPLTHPALKRFYAFR